MRVIYQNVLEVDACHLIVCLPKPISGRRGGGRCGSRIIITFNARGKHAGILIGRGRKSVVISDE